jgi:hypothetical protein
MFSTTVATGCSGTNAIALSMIRTVAQRDLAIRTKTTVATGYNENLVIGGETRARTKRPRGKGP